MYKQFFSFILMTALFAALLSSCEKDDAPTFAVTFDSKGGTPTPLEQIVKKGGTVEKPADPTLTNHLFAGWTTADNATSSLWDFEKGTVTANMTLYAKWAQNTYTVTVSSDENGKASASVTSAVEGELITLTATANSDYRFVEWQVIEGGITLSSTTDNPATFIMTDKSVEVKAIFAPFVGLLESIIVSGYNDLYDYNYQHVYVFEYDSQNRFMRFTTSPYYNGTTSLNYNADGDLVGYYWIYQGRDWVSATFSKNGNKINFTIEQYLNRWSRTNANGELELNDQGLPVKVTSESESRQLGVGGVVSNWSNTVTLTWQNGNLTKTEWVREDEQGSSTGTINYTHDDRKMPFYYCKTPKLGFWLFYYVGNDEFYGFNENNIKTETREDGSIITYEYTYNDDGFPVTRTWATSVGTATETYTYK
jgi:uncharacterized repeat protein (TIGR02543 family)